MFLCYVIYISFQYFSECYHFFLFVFLRQHFPLLSSIKNCIKANDSCSACTEHCSDFELYFNLFHNFFFVSTFFVCSVGPSISSDNKFMRLLHRLFIRFILRSFSIFSWNCRALKSQRQHTQKSNTKWIKWDTFWKKNYEIASNTALYGALVGEKKKASLKLDICPLYSIYFSPYTGQPNRIQHIPPKRKNEKRVLKRTIF